MDTNPMPLWTGVEVLGRIPTALVGRDLFMLSEADRHKALDDILNYAGIDQNRYVGAIFFLILEVQHLRERIEVLESSRDGS